MPANCTSCHGAGASKHGRLCARCNGSGVALPSRYSDLPARPMVQGGNYRPHYPARPMDEYLGDLMYLFQKHCRHTWHGHSATEVLGGNVVSECWRTCDNCGLVQEYPVIKRLRDRKDGKQTGLDDGPPHSIIQY